MVFGTFVHRLSGERKMTNKQFVIGCFKPKTFNGAIINELVIIKSISFPSWLGGNPDVVMVKWEFAREANLLFTKLSDAKSYFNKLKFDKSIYSIYEIESSIKEATDE